jgi:DNA modification methylase
MQIEMWKIEDIKPYENNPRDNSGAVDAVAESIRQFGFKIPVLVDKNGVLIAGHTRILAAKKLGMDRVPVIKVEDLSPEQVRGFRILDNQSASLSKWDFELLSIEMQGLNDSGFDINTLAFDPDMISRLLDPGEKEGLTDPDEIPELPVEPVTRPGDIWLLGSHRLMCGDSTSERDVTLLMDNKTPVLLVTDPPYGVAYDPQWRAEAGINKNKGRMGVVQNDDRVDWTPAYKLSGAKIAYVWHAGKYGAEVKASLEIAGYEIIAQIIWNKDKFALSRGDYHWKHEPCWYAHKTGSDHNWQGARDQCTVWDINRVDKGVEGEDQGHGTQKPVECMARPIVNNTFRDDLVYDAFLGSGTTIIAAEKHNRTCYGMEIDPRYCDAIVQRWEKFTGKKAQRITSNEKNPE